MNMATGSCCSHRLQPSSDTFEMRRRRRRRRMGGENPSGNVWGDDTKKNGIIIKVTTWNGWKCFKSLKWAGIFPHLWFFLSSSSFFFSPIFPKWNKFHCLFLPSKKRKKSSVQLLFSFFFFDFELLEMIYVATPQHALKMDTKIFNQLNWNRVNIWNREIQWILFFLGELFMWQRRSTHSKWTPIKIEWMKLKSC